jgi:glycosyltransferase involved in cell wall biosynthesis
MITVEPAPTAPALLMMANFSNQTGYAWSNIYRLFDVVGEAFRERGVRTLVSFRRLRPPVDALRGDFDFLELSPRPRSLREGVRLLRAIRVNRVRYVYLTDHASADWRYALMRLAGVRRILVHNRVSVPSPVRVTEQERGIRGWLKYVYQRIPLIAADRTYAVSGFVRDRLVLKARVPEARVETILNGIRIDRFLAPMPAPSERPIRIFTGCRATRHKGIHILIEALAVLRDEHGITDAEVVFAGDGPDRERFEALVLRLDLKDRFEFVGEVEDTSELMGSADIVVVPSIWGDACPSAVSEGLASGRPLVATRVGGVPELVGRADSALLVTPGDPAELAAALAGLIRAPEKCRELGARGRRRAREALGEEAYHKRMIDRLLSDTGVVSTEAVHV